MRRPGRCHYGRAIPLTLLVLAASFATVGCGSDRTSPTGPASPALQKAAISGVDSGPWSVLSAATLQAMNDAIQDEYHAQFTYLKVMEKFGDVQPFFRIIVAEERHSEAIARLFVNYGSPVPESRWNLGNVPVFSSLAEACAGAVAAELQNIALYDEFLTLELPRDVRNVFTNLRAASLENHLPAFEACCACSQ